MRRLNDAGLPLAKLLGAHRDSVQCYNLGGFLHTPLDQGAKNGGDFREYLAVLVESRTTQLRAEDIRRLTMTREARG